MAAPGGWLGGGGACAAQFNTQIAAISAGVRRFLSNVSFNVFSVNQRFDAPGMVCCSETLRTPSILFEPSNLKNT